MSIKKNVVQNVVFEARNGSVAKVVTICPDGKSVIAQTYHPKSANDFCYNVEIKVNNLKSGCFKSPDSPNQYGGYVGQGVFRRKHDSFYYCWYNTLRNASVSGRKLHNGWYDFQHFAAWYVSYSECANIEWELNNNFLPGSDVAIGPKTICLLPKEINISVFVNKKSRISVKIGKAYKISDAVNLGLAENILFVSEVDAISMYCRLKEEKVKRLAEQYRQQLPEHVYQALKVWKCCVDMS